VSKVTIVGSRDRQLEELLKGTVFQVSSLEFSGLSALSVASAKAPDVLILDLRERAHLPAETSNMRRHHPEMGVVIVAKTMDPGLLLEAMRAGVNELVTDPVTQASLEKAITSVAGKHSGSEGGDVFAFIGAKGGVGATTAAVNVATALGSISKPGRTLLIDLHQAGGDAAVFLGAEPRFSVLDALENTRRLDEAYFKGLVSEVAPRTDLLAAPERASSVQLEAAKIRAVLTFVRSAYRYIVLDVPRSDSAVLESLDQVSAIIIVANQELATVKSASRLAAGLRQRYGHERIKVVVSRSDRQADIGQADVERAIGSEIDHTFPSDYRHALQALNKGRPLALDNHNDLSASFKSFAVKLTGGRPEREPAPARSSFLGRLTPRRS
jgi:pilus assembly protein CpaE